MSDTDSITECASSFSEGTEDKFYQTDFYSEDEKAQHLHRSSRLEEMNSIDPGHHLLYRNVVVQETNRAGEVVREKTKRVKIDCFATNLTPGASIRNATTGIRYRHKVGGAEEDLYFSAIMATGEFGQTSTVLFYDNPEQYESHLKIKLTPEIKEQWLNKYRYARLQLSRVDSATNQTVLIR